MDCTKVLDNAPGNTRASLEWPGPYSPSPQYQTVSVSMRLLTWDWWRVTPSRWGEKLGMGVTWACFLWLPTCYWGFVSIQWKSDGNCMVIHFVWHGCTAWTIPCQSMMEQSRPVSVALVAGLVSWTSTLSTTCRSILGVSYVWYDLG